jgi:hypothetical protein
VAGMFSLFSFSFLHDNASAHRSFVVKKSSRQVQCEGFGASAIFPTFLPPKIFALSEIVENADSYSFQELFRNIYERWGKYVAAQGNCLEGNVV